MRPGAELGRLLDERDPVLLVIDDVWEQSSCGRSLRRPLLHQAVTTRIPDLLPDGGARIAVDAMSDEQARELLADGVVGLPPR